MLARMKSNRNSLTYNSSVNWHKIFRKQWGLPGKVEHIHVLLPSNSPLIYSGKRDSLAYMQLRDKYRNFIIKIFIKANKKPPENSPYAHQK